MKNMFFKAIALLLLVAMLSGCASGGDTAEGVSSTSSAVESSAASTTESSASSKSDPSSVQPSSEPTSSTVTTEYEKYSGTRDPWLWPFSVTSIWNMPIGDGAQLKPAGFKRHSMLSIDVEHHIVVPEGSPTVDIYSPSSWETRWPGKDYLGKMQIPADLIIPDGNTVTIPNACSAFLMPDGRTIKQLEPTCRLETGTAQIVGLPLGRDIDIYGDGIQGTHYGSGLSAIGGSIRKGELTSDEPIRHALKLNVWGKKYLYYDKTTNQGYIWPADRHDGYAASGDNAYGGTDPALRMGTLLTIPKNITAEGLGLKSEVGKKIFYALQNYGCYIVDDHYGGGYSLSAEYGVCEEVYEKYSFRPDNIHAPAKYYNDMMLMIESLHIVTNNSPTSIGGGGTPCKPLAPDFE